MGSGSLFEPSKDPQCRHFDFRTCRWILWSALHYITRPKTICSPPILLTVIPA